MDEREQMQIDFINGEIAAENAEGGENAGGEELPGAVNAARKPFRISDFDPPHDKEMAVFTHAKKLSEYIFVITEKSPKKLRWSIVARLQNTSVDVVENLYRANYERGEERLTFQKKAMVSINLLDFFTETAKTKQAISLRQMTIIGKQIYEVKKLLNGWIRSEKYRTR